MHNEMDVGFNSAAHAPQIDHHDGATNRPPNKPKKDSDHDSEKRGGEDENGHGDKPLYTDDE
jgi:hypothetical protein